MGPKGNGVLPFQAISYIPSMIFSEGIQGSKLYEALLFQVIWAIVLIIPIVLMWRTARKRLIVQGDDEMIYIKLFLQYASQYIKQNWSIGAILSLDYFLIYHYRLLI